MNDQVNNIKNQIDWSIVISTVVASVIIGVGVFAARKAGLGAVAAVVKGG